MGRYPAPAGSGLVYVVQVHLQRRDGQPVDPWLLAQLEGRVTREIIVKFYE